MRVGAFSHIPECTNVVTCHLLAAAIGPARRSAPSRATALPAFRVTEAPATQAQINRVVGQAIDAAGNLYLAEELNNRVRKITSQGVITTIAGTGAPGFTGDNGPAPRRS